MHRSLLLALATVSALAARPAVAQSRYTVTNMGSGTPTAINASGQVVGYATDAWLYSNDVMTDLGTLPGGTSSAAYGINASGQIVGASGTNAYSHAFLYSNGTMTDLGLLPGGITSVATAINANGQIVGYADTSPQALHPFLYSNGAMQDLLAALGPFHGLPTPPASTTTGKFWLLDDAGSTATEPCMPWAVFAASEATGINNNGQVVGWSCGDGKHLRHAFLYSNGTIHDLGILAGGSAKRCQRHQRLRRDRRQFLRTGEPSPTRSST